MGSDQSSDSRFICYLALPLPAQIFGSELCDNLWRKFSQMLSHLGLPRLKGNFAGDDKTLLLEIGSTIVTVLFVDAPLPKDAWERPIVLDKVWPKAKDAMAIQRVHVIISNLNSVLDHNAAL